MFLSETTGPISVQFCRNVSLMIFYQDCSSHLGLSKNMAARGRGFFSLYIYIENFKNLLVRNHLTDFNIILQKCSFCDPLPRLFKPFGFVKYHGRQGAGLISSPVRSTWRAIVVTPVVRVCVPVPVTFQMLISQQSLLTEASNLELRYLGGSSEIPRE